MRTRCDSRHQSARDTLLMTPAHVCVRLVGAAVLSAIFAVLVQPTSLLAALGVAVSILVLGWPGRKVVLRGFVAVNLFVLLLWVIVPLSGSGDVLHQVGPLSIRSEGVMFSIAATLRANAILCVLLGCLVAVPLHVAVRGLESVGVSSRLCSMLYFCVRYIQDIQKMHLRLQTAASLRCFAPGMNRHTWRTVGHMFAMTLIRSLDQAHRVHQAMQLRGYDGSFRRLPLPAMTWRDWAVMVVLLGVAAGVLALEFGSLQWDMLEKFRV